MARKPSLADAVSPPPRHPETPAPAALHSSTRTTSGRAAARVGKKGIAFWVEPIAGKQLGQIALDEDTTVQALMEEALDLLFANRGKNRMARSN